MQSKMHAKQYSNVYFILFLLLEEMHHMSYEQHLSYNNGPDSSDGKALDSQFEIRGSSPDDGF